MHNPLFNLLGSSLVPELGSDVAAGSSRHVHLVLVGVAAIRAYPDELAVFVSLNPNLAVIAAHLAVVALGIELGVHDVVVNVFHDCQHRLDIVLHVRHFHVADGTARGQLLELCLEGQLVESIDRLCDMYVVAVGDVILVRHTRESCRNGPEAFGEFVGGGL